MSQNIQQLPDSDADSVELDSSIVIHDEDIEVHHIRTAFDTEQHFPFKPCTLEDLENDIINMACSNDSAIYFCVQALHQHFLRSKSYTAEKMHNIKQSLLGRIQARQPSQERYAEVVEIVTKFF